MLSPGFPAEMAFFTKGLAAVGANVIGIGDQPAHVLPAEAREALSHYEHVSLTDEAQVLGALEGIARHVHLDQVECLWEPYMMLAARIREHFGIPGMSMEQTLPFRDKEQMKRVLDAAGIRTPRHFSTATAAGAWEAAEVVGYPLIVKPIDGAGSADTFRVDSPEDLAAVLAMVRHVPHISVEEFVDGDEFTFDTICGGGDLLMENICRYRPRPLQARSHEWISPMTVALRDLSAEGLAGGRQMGRDVLRALGFTSGFTHMEWYRTFDGEVVFGEIGARPPGGRTVDVINYATSSDMFLGWAEAVVHGRMAQPVTRHFNAASVFKRAQGEGRIVAIEGLDRLLSEYGDAVVAVDLVPVGSPRRDWRATLISDGMVIVRHPDLGPLIEMAERFASELRLYAA